MNYKAEYLDNTNFLNEFDIKLLNSYKLPFKGVKENKKLLEHQEFEFVYISAKTEGNTYTKAEAITLLEKGLTAGGKPFYDAKMLQNIKSAFDEFVLNPREISKEVIKDIHFMLNEGLLEKQKLGIFRDEAVLIKGANYIPPVKREFINSEIDYLLRQAKKIKEPFTKAIYLHNNLAYIQPFIDGNKRTARIIQAMVLSYYDIMPLISKESYISLYLDSLIEYYETGKYDKYIEYFKIAYEEQYHFLKQVL